VLAVPLQVLHMAEQATQSEPEATWPAGHVVKQVLVPLLNK